MLSPLEARPLTIIALGDSTTAGTPFFRSPAEAPPDGAGDPEAPYTYWLGKKHADWTVLNYGIAGQRTDGIRDRLIPLLAMKPK